MKKIFAFLLALALPLSAAHAQLSLAQLVVELQPGKHDRQDVEVANAGQDPAYVEIDPREIVGAGTPSEAPRTDPDPEKLGLLVSPARLILQPGEHRLIRFATLATAADRERVYRVTVKPVVGKLATTQSGLKILVGYDVLILVRPVVASPSLTATRAPGRLTFRNDGNVSVELTNGKQCDSAGSCAELPDKRLYAGASWSVDLKRSGPVDYDVLSPGREDHRRF